MATKGLTKMASLWTSRSSTEYTKMETEGEEGGSSSERASLEQSLDRAEADRFTQWPNFITEDGYRDQHDRQSIRSLAPVDPVELFFPHRVAGRHSSDPVLRIKRMFTRFPVRDMSWVVGISFTFGSIVFVANGFFLLLPMIDPTTDFGAEGPYLTPASSVLGTLIFLVGSWVAVLEALNINRGMSVTNGLEVEMTMSTELPKAIKDEEPSLPHHHHTQSSSSQSSTTSMQQPESIPSDSSSDIDIDQPTLALVGSPAFMYFPTVHQLRTTYIHDLYFLASTTQLIGATVFTLATITSLPGVIDFTNFILVSLTNYLPASLGGVLFFAAATLQILNAQDNWWKPKPRSMAWHMGVWNAVGSFGFMLAGALPWFGWDFQATLAAFWGSWAFLVGSALQWYCAMGSYV